MTLLAPAYLLCTVLVSTPPLLGAPQPGLLVGFPRYTSVETRGEPVHVGTTRHEVEARLGMPDAMLSRDVWVYRQFQANDDAVNQLGYDTLLVIFAESRVVSLRLVPAKPVEAFLAKQRHLVRANRTGK